MRKARALPARLLNLLDHAAHVVVELAIGALGLAFIAGCLLAWRLSQGPIDVSTLVRRELPALAGAGDRLSVGRASLAWEGFYAADSPIDIRLENIDLRAPDGAALLTLPRARVTLSPAQLLRLRIVPRSVELDDALLQLLRTRQGGLQLDFGQGSGGRGNTLAAELARPARRFTQAGGPLPWLGQLQVVRIRRADVQVRDAVLGLAWQAGQVNADLRRQPDGGVTGSAALVLQAGNVRAELHGTASFTADGTHLTAASGDVNPAALAKAASAFATLAMVDLPVRFSLAADLAANLAPRSAHLEASAGAGRVFAGTGSVAVRSASARVDATPGEARLVSLTILPAAPSGASAAPPVITGTALATRRAGHIEASATLRVDRVAFADLGAYWPLGTGGGGRPWVTQNITSGTARDAVVTATLTAADDLSALALTSLTGGLAADGMTLWWLRPIPPITGAEAKLVIEGPDAFRVLVARGAQGKLRLQDSLLHITGLAAKDQIGDIEANLAGPLPEALALLNHRRLSLLSRFPVSFTDPAGDARATIKVHLPLDDRVTMDQIGISAKASLAHVHLGQVAAGRSLDDGALKLAADANELRIGGSGVVAGIPSMLDFFMDFRAGPPSQVLERLTASGTADAAALRANGMPATLMTDGTAGLHVAYASRRDTSGTVDLSADLTGAVLATPAGWSKPQGDAASASATLLLRGGTLAAVRALRADGPGLKLRGQAVSGPKGNTLHIDRGLIGRTDLHGTIALPSMPDAPIRIDLAGPALDVSPFLDASGTEPATSERKGRAWDAALAVGTVILGKSESISPVSLAATSDGLRIERARLNAASGGVRASITPAPSGRRLSIASEDAGEVLRAAGVADNISGGRLQVEGHYADTEPHAPLSGTATMDRFRVLDAPVMGRLLKAMTLYGAVDLLRGPGLGFARAIVPFRWQQRVLTLQSARAYSASLGLTARGDVNLAAHTADLSGTVVPAYFFNTLLGHLPLLGRLFSPEKGGGVFAARYTVKGALRDPKVGVNPLSVLTPGFLRGLFGPA